MYLCKQIYQKINSLESSYENIIPEPFFNIDVPIDKYDTLNECLEQYTEKEILDDDNKILNDKTNKREILCNLVKNTDKHKKLINSKHKNKDVSKLFCDLLVKNYMKPRHSFVQKKKVII